MQKLSRQSKLIALTITLTCSMAWVDVASAQDGVQESLEEVIVVGTRRQDRTATNTPVPVDVFGEADLQSVSSPELLDVLNKLVPSLNVGRWARGDGASFIRPFQLRGLDSDKSLILVNGKRRHRSALVQLSGFGSHGPDLAALPGIALRNVEVLRDGASAMYGSDAIAGVLNFNLKDLSDGVELQARYGQYTLGNENSVSIAGNVGLPLGDKGFVTISAEWTDAEATSRGVEFNRTIAQSGLTPAESALVSGFFDHDGDPNTPDQERFGPDALTEIYAGGQLVSIFNGSDGVPDDTDTRYADNLRFAEISDSELVQQWGRPNRDAIHAVVNAGYDLSNSTSLYGWANYSNSDADRNSVHRRPGTSPMALVRTPDGEIWNPRDLFPASFTPRFFGNVIDQGLTGGLRGERSSGMTWDIGGRYGQNEIRYENNNTWNPSLGPSSPTDFRPGNLISEEIGLTADFTTAVSLGFAEDAFFAFGVELREEKYNSEAGDAASAVAGPYSVVDPWNFETSATEAADGENGGIIECRLPGLDSVGTPCPALDPIHNVMSVGSQGFPGYGPLSVFDYDRDSWAVYGDLEMDVTDKLLLTAAGRYEDFSDFGENFSWRLAGRYELDDRFAIRGSMGTGFRAPTPGQIATTNISGRPGTLTDPFLVGVFPQSHPAAQVFGAVPLDAETSWQWTLGLTSKPFDGFTFTLDYYYIEVDDRFSMSSDFQVGPAERLVLIASGVPGAASIEVVRFFTNDIDTETDGVDLVATYVTDWARGVTDVSLSANWNRTEVTRRTPRPNGFFLRDVDVHNIENGSPKPRAIVDVRHAWGDRWSFLLRGNYYGSYEIMNSGNLSQIQEMGSVFQVDAMLSWEFNDGRYNLTLGGNNVFDQQPDPAEFGVCCGVVVRFSSLVDWQGPYYYVTGRIRWN
jgi:iron complex outermembrane receptor protein